MSLVDPSRWPKVSVAEAFRLLTAPGAPYEMETLDVRGIPTRVYCRARPHLRELFDQSRGFGDSEFLIYRDERVTFEQHWRAASALGFAFLDRYGIAKGDRIALCLRNYPEWVIAAWAALAIGAVLTPINAWSSGEEIVHCLKDSGARILIADSERVERLRDHFAELSLPIIVVRQDSAVIGTVPMEDIIGAPSGYGTLPDKALPDPGLTPDDDATIFYTSGTTGKPKGAVGTHRNIATNLVNTSFRAARAAVRRGDPPPPLENPSVQRCLLLPVPLFHVTGFHSALIPAMANRTKLVLMYKWDAAEALALIERERINGMTAVPSMYWHLVECPDVAHRDVSSLDTLGYGGASPGAGLAERLHQLFPAVALGQGYGATETSSLVASNSAEDLLTRPQSVGPRVPSCDLRVIAEDGSDAPVGSPGELWVKGPNVVRGYWNDAAATAQSFRDGWYATGDIVRLDEDGFVEILDRSKDMVIRGGENIY
ncbi:MAG TPA: class I adenylate-forming enzyme family protein, partial [Rhizomicrobium sp.]